MKSPSNFLSLSLSLALAFGILTGGCHGDAQTIDRAEPVDAPTFERAGRSAPAYIVLDGSVEALRSEFNADSGKVRAILLAAPT